MWVRIILIPFVLLLWLLDVVRWECQRGVEPTKPPPPSNSTSAATDRCAPDAAAYGTNGNSTYYRFASGKVVERGEGRL